MYKGFKSHREELTKALSVEFVGEEGIDAGAIRLSFFELLLAEVNSHLFEGGDCRRIPKRDWGLATLFEIGGVMVAHSLLNGGPGLPCLLPAVYHYLCSPEIELPPELHPSVDDIPQSLAYQDLVEFVGKVKCSSC